VYVAVGSGDDNNSGQSESDPVKTLDRALAIWEDAGSAEAKIMLVEDISDSYTESGVATADTVIHFENLLKTRPGITALTLAGSGGGKTIANGTAPARRILYIDNPGTTITLKNLTVTGGKGNVGRGITVQAGSLVIAGGVIIENNTALFGGGVWLSTGGGASLTMTGGEIRSNTATGDSGLGGGGVYVGTGSSFTLKAGTIWDNTSASQGGGVCTRGGTIIMEGGTVKDNRAVKAGGGVYVSGTNPAVFTMRNGTISANKVTDATGRGGGVCVGANGKFEMNGGEIKKNNSGNDGGGVYISGNSGQTGKALITQGLIGASSDAEGNTAKYGGGVYVGDYGYLELGDLMNSASGDAYPCIQHNSASGGSPTSTGGGLVINGIGAEALFYHGTIGGNRAADQGGGILIVNGTLDMQGGRVKENQAPIGPGIMVEKLSSTITSPANRFILSRYARVLEPGNPVYLDGSAASSKRWITLSIAEFYQLNSSDDIANVTADGYSSGNEILKMPPSSPPNNVILTYYERFNVNGNGSISSGGTSLNSDGTLK
jgi:hypothetical protein